VTGNNNLPVISLSMFLMGVGGVLMVASRRRDDEF